MCLSHLNTWIQPECLLWPHKAVLLLRMYNLLQVILSAYVRKGRALLSVGTYTLRHSTYVPALLGGFYYRQGWQNTLNVMQDILFGLCGLPELAPGLSPMAELTVSRKDGLTLVQLVNESGCFAGHYFPPVPMRDVRLRLHRLIPWPIPASIYGLVLLFLALQTGLLRVEAVRDVGNFLLDLMPVLFVAPTVSLLDCWQLVAPVLVPVTTVVAVSTIVTFAMSGRSTQWMLRRKQRREDNFDD